MAFSCIPSGDPRTSGVGFSAGGGWVQWTRPQQGPCLLSSRSSVDNIPGLSLHLFFFRLSASLCCFLSPLFFILYFPTGWSWVGFKREEEFPRLKSDGMLRRSRERGDGGLISIDITLCLMCFGPLRLLFLCPMLSTQCETCLWSSHTHTGSSYTNLFGITCRPQSSTRVVRNTQQTYHISKLCGGKLGPVVLGGVNQAHRGLSRVCDRNASQHTQDKRARIPRLE